MLKLKCFGPMEYPIYLLQMSNHSPSTLLSKNHFGLEPNLCYTYNISEALLFQFAKHFSNNFKLDMLDRFNSSYALGKKIFNCSITRELSVKGWNWGVANFNGSVLNFEV